jgi:hypothetical protein
MKVMTHLNYAIKIIVIAIAVLFVVGSSNGKEFKVKNNNLNLSTDLTLMALRVEENIKNDIYGAKETYTGDLTGYGADCPLCGGTLACMPSLDVLHGNVTYNDATYGSVRIVAADKNFPLGTIVKITERMNDGSYETFNAIVLDRGDRNIGLNSKYIFDLLLENEQIAYSYGVHYDIDVEVLKVGNTTDQQNIKRYGHL